MMVGTVFTGLTALASECISQAEDEIDKRLSKRYDISSSYFQTTTSIPPQLRQICLWLSTGYMYEANARGSKDSYARADRYINKANNNIKDLIEYKANLLDTAGSIISDSTESLKVRSSTSDYVNTFNEDDPVNWTVDSDKLDDISNERS